MYHETEAFPAATTAAADSSTADFLTEAQPIILFLKEEIQYSSELLQQLAGAFFSEINALSEADHADSIETSLHRLTEAFQGEDRIQQRLQDIIAALETLEKLTDPTQQNHQQQLSMSIIKQLKLGEMQKALAIKANINDPTFNNNPTNTPSIGDIDWF